MTPAPKREVDHVRLTVHSGRPRDLDAVTIYRILALRVDVFVVEQACPYPELDGRDLESGARWVWAANGPDIVATLRILVDPDGRARIGRVATARESRSAGTAGRVLWAALDLIGDQECVLDAQSYLRGWYERFGFVRNGPDFVEDAITHVPMVRPRPPEGAVGAPQGGGVA